MRPGPDTIRDDLADVLRWGPAIRDLAATATDPRPGANVERTVAYLHSIKLIEADLDAVAREVTATRGDDQAGKITNPALYLVGAAAWLARSALAEPVAFEIRAIRNRAARLVGYAPERSDYACMACRLAEGPGPRLERQPTTAGLSDIYECPNCGFRARIEPAGPWNNQRPLNTLQSAWRAVLYTTELRLAPAEAADLLGEHNTGRIRQWLHRGRLAKDEDGKVALADVARLVVESEAYKTTHPRKTSK